MEQTRRFWKALVAVIVAIVTGLLGGMAVQVKEASALNGDYEAGQGPAIYYFSDYYPSIGYDTLSEDYDGYANIIYDNQQVSVQSFAFLVETDYFSGFDSETIVVIDLKTIKPMGETLYTLFSYLKEVEECYTVFISLYASNSFDNDAFLGYLDQYVQGDLKRTENFVALKLGDIQDYLNELNGGVSAPFENVAIFVDNRFVGATQSVGGEDLCNTSHFFRCIINGLMTKLSTGTDFDELAEELDERNIRLFTVLSDGRVKDLIHGTPCGNDMANFIQTIRSDGLEGRTFDYICGMAISHLSMIFYQGAMDLQNANNPIPIHVLEVDIIVYGENGLWISEFAEAELRANDAVLPDILGALDQALSVEEETEGE